MIDFRLAGYRLDGILGKGGNGVVCSGEDSETGMPVAVKFLRAGREHKRHAFFSEAQVLARLNHVGIVRIVDLGTTDESPFDSGPETPYIVMERIDGMPMQDCIGGLTFSGIVGIADRLLDALSYLHARGVVHRDVKPANVIVRPLERKVSLVDFGLAFGADFGTTDTSRVEGTPDYMAPEQINGSPRDIGPWTDLYALGCVLWRAATGSAPYADKDEHDTLVAHLVGALPTFSPRLPLLDGFEPWLRRLLFVDPHRRYDRAADARAALADLDVDRATPWVESNTDSSTTDNDTIVSESAPTRDVPTYRVGGRESAGAPAITTAPFPADWRVVEPRNPASFRAAADLRLFALREIESVGRLTERDALWSALGVVFESNRPQIAVLQGEYGMGKSRLARWLAERAHEVGAADTLTIRHDGNDAPNRALVSLATQILRCEGLSGDELRQWNWKELERLGIGVRERVRLGIAVQTLLDGEATRGGGGPTTPDQDELVDAVATLVKRASTRRGLVIVADDVHHSPQTSNILKRLIGSSDGFPIFVVVTSDARTDSVANLVDFAQERGGPVIEVGRMSDDEVGELVDALIAPDSSAREVIIASATGSPLFAIELVREWWERGALVAHSGERPRLRTDDPPVPKALNEIWCARLTAAVEAVAAADRDDALRALELAAALGSEVSNDEWSVLSEMAGVELPQDVVRELIRRELILASPKGWRFAHPLLRQSVVSIARENNRWTEHHANCLQMLEEYGNDDRWTSIRKAHHARQAEHFHRALDLHLQAFRDVRSFGEMEECRQLRRAHEAICDHLKLGPESEPRVAQMLMNVSLGNKHPVTNDRVGWLVDMAQLSRKHGYDHLLAPASRGLARYELSLGNDREALELFEESLAALGDDGDPIDEMYVRLQIGSTLHRVGHKDHALASLYRGLELARRLGPMWEARAYNEIGRVALLMDRIADAREMASKGRSLTEQAENPRMKTLMVTLQGDVERAAGALDVARSFYEELLPRGARTTDEFGALREWKLALLDLAEGDESAFERFRQARPSTMREPVDAAVDLVFGTSADAAAARLDMADHDERWMLFDLDARFVMSRFDGPRED